MICIVVVSLSLATNHTVKLFINLSSCVVQGQVFFYLGDLHSGGDVFFVGTKPYIQLVYAFI